MPAVQGFRRCGRYPALYALKDVDEIVNTVALLAGSFGGVNLEDISAPRCFEIEGKAQAALRYTHLP